MKKFFLIFYFSLSLFCDDNIYIDNDLDGVIDIYDQCLNTSFDYEVDKYGCAIDKEVSFNTLINLGFEKHSFNNKNYKYDYEIKKLSLYINNQNYLFNISQNYLNFDYKLSDSNIVNNDYSYNITTLEFGYFINYKFMNSIKFIVDLNDSSNDNLNLDKTNYAVELDFIKDFDNLHLYSSIEYNIIGDSSNYNNYLNFQVGLLKYHNTIYYGLDFYYNQASNSEDKEYILIQPKITIPILDDYQLNLSYSTNINYTKTNKKALSFNLSYFF